MSLFGNHGIYVGSVQFGALLSLLQYILNGRHAHQQQHYHYHH